MKKNKKTFLIYISMALFVFIIILYFNENNYIQSNKKNSPIILNQDFIEGLYKTELNLTNDKEVFSFVFNSLDKEVTVYPTENFFYFIFPYKGRIIGGSIGLHADNRDDGVLGFGYGEQREDSSDLEGLFSFTKDRAGGGGQYTEKDGVIVKKINDFKYQVNFEGKSVIFNLNDIGYNPPKKAKLEKEEVFVGPVFDDSGLKFFLIFNKEVPHLYFILNEDYFVPEQFEKYSNYKDLLIGRRTKFVFYNDTENNRKILVGVKGENVLQNNWYDGPFDHMPDNYIKTGKIPDYQKYLEASYFGVKGRIDKYGRYIYENGTRIAVGPYYVYFSERDFEFIDYYCKNFKTKSEFYNCITTQVFDVPKEIEKKIYPGY